MVAITKNVRLLRYCSPMQAVLISCAGTVRRKKSRSPVVVRMAGRSVLRNYPGATARPPDFHVSDDPERGRAGRERCPPGIKRCPKRAASLKPCRTALLAPRAMLMLRPARTGGVPGRMLTDENAARIPTVFLHGVSNPVSVLPSFARSQPSCRERTRWALHR